MAKVITSLSNLTEKQMKLLDKANKRLHEPSNWLAVSLYEAGFFANWEIDYGIKEARLIAGRIESEQHPI